MKEVESQIAGETQIIEANDALPEGVSAAVGKVRDVIGHEEFDAWQEERQEAREYHHDRILRTYGRPVGALVLRNRFR